jgi:hypothetical protein
MVAIFDGDYASWSFGGTDPVLGKTVQEAIVATIVGQPRVMRDMPHLLQRAGLDLVDVLAFVYADIGPGGFFLNAAENFVPIVARAGMVLPEAIESWLAEQRQAAADGTFFSASNFYAYLATTPS